MTVAPIDSDRLATFVAVAREQGFSRAARALGRTQSAVSQAVLHLERDVGHRLFFRDGRTTRLTEAGKILLEHGERVLEDLGHARERLGAMGDLRTGQIVVGASDTLAYYVLPPVLAAYRARYPGIDVRLDNRPSPATAIEVAERRVDVGIVTLPLPGELLARGRPVAERIRVEPLSPTREVAIFPPGHAGARRQRIDVVHLAEHPLLLLDRTTGTRAFLDAAFAAAGVRPRVLMEMSSVEVLKRLVELGFGVSVVPAISIEREVTAGVLVARELRVEGAHPGRSIGLVLPAAEVSSRATAAFSEIAREKIRDRPH